MPKRKELPKSNPKVTKAHIKKKLEDALIVLDEIIKVKVGPSPIHGVGLFAMRKINRGEKLYTNAIPQMFDVPYKMFKRLRPEVSNHLLERWPNIVNGSHFMFEGMLATYLNHSDQPNYDAKNDKALRKIKEGEEITENYRLIKGYGKVYPWLTKKDVL